MLPPPCRKNLNPPPCRPIFYPPPAAHHSAQVWGRICLLPPIRRRWPPTTCLNNGWLLFTPSPLNHSNPLLPFLPCRQTVGFDGTACAKYHGTAKWYFRQHKTEEKEREGVREREKDTPPFLPCRQTVGFDGTACAKYHGTAKGYFHRHKREEKEREGVPANGWF